MKYYIAREKFFKNKEISLNRNRVMLNSGVLNIADLRSSQLDAALTDIPPKAQKQLNKTGKTTYSVITKTVVIITK